MQLKLEVYLNKISTSFHYMLENTLHLHFNDQERFLAGDVVKAKPWYKYTMSSVCGSQRFGGVSYLHLQGVR
jgi:hypothetical protein